MRIHRITIKNFRGVADNTVEFAAQGVTVLVGPNEIGKSSIPEGLDVLLRIFHDSKRSEITDLKPVGNDAGPEVEADISLGEYRFVYTKRWLKNATTTLTITEPTHQQLTGRDAHDKVIELLDSHLDRPLFDALRYVQGTAVGQHGISKSTSLMAALDQATSSHSAEPDSGAVLIDSIESEYERYFTAGGKVKVERVQVGERLAVARTSLESSERSLKGLEQLGAEFSSVVERITKAEGRLETCRIERVEIDERLRELDALERELSEAAADCRLAESEQAGVLRDQATRIALIDAEHNVSDDVNRLQAQYAAVAETLSVADASLAGVLVEIDRCEQAHQAALDAEEMAGLELQRRDAHVAVGLLGRRLDDFNQAEELRVAATRVLEANDAITTKARGALDQALTRLTQAKAVRTAGQPTVIVEPTSDLTVEVDGVKQTIAGGEIKRWTVDGTSTVALGDIAKVIVTAPNDEEDEEELAAAHSNLTRVVEKYGLDVSDPRGDLENRLAAIATAKQDIVHADSRRDAALFDLTPEQLKAKYENAVAIIAGFDDADTSLDVEAAKAALAEATASRSTAAQALGSSTAERRVLDEHTNIQRIELSRLGGEHSHAEKSLERATEALVQARAARSDDYLSAALDSSKGALAVTIECQQALQARRDASSPEAVRAVATNLESRERRVLNELDADRTHREQLTGELRALGSQDLQADLDRSQGEVDTLTREYEALERRARAAQLLRNTFIRHRENARANRARPYADEVNRLGRFVFGPTAHFAINSSDFTVTARTMDGTTVSFDQMSTGAKEQMSVVATLACAILVNPEGRDGDAGAPVILDDVLGFADPTRLRRLGPVFAEAAKSAQVILLTASPERYESIGEATFIHF
jgi:hypothetical protein